MPFDVKSDELTNLEVGWKLDLMDGTLRFNGAFFLVDKRPADHHLRYQHRQPVLLDNAADAEVRGWKAISRGWHLTT